MIHGDINEAVRLKTLEVGDWYIPQRFLQIIDRFYPAKIQALSETLCSVLENCGTPGKDSYDLLVHPLTRETLPNGTHRFWYVGSKRPIGVLSVGTMFGDIDTGLYSPGTGSEIIKFDHDGFAVVTPHGYASRRIGPLRRVRVIRYSEPAKRAPMVCEPKADGSLLTTVQWDNLRRVFDEVIRTALEAKSPEPERTEITLAEVPVGRWFKYNFKKIKTGEFDNNALRDDGTPTSILWPNKPCTLLRADFEPAKPTHMERLPEMLRRYIENEGALLGLTLEGMECFARAICEAFPEAIAIGGGK